MNSIVIFAGLIIILFVVALIARRRFGILGLALIAGSMLSSLWSGLLTDIISQVNYAPALLPLDVVVAVFVTLLPAVVLMLTGRKYQKTTGRVIGATAFTFLAMALLVEPLGESIILAGWGQQVYAFFVTNRVAIVTVGIVFSVLDILTTKTVKEVKEKGKH